jgi:hypothetical protein
MELISRVRSLEGVESFSPPLSTHISILALGYSKQCIKSISGEFTKRTDENEQYKNDKKWQTIANIKRNNGQHPDIEKNRINIFARLNSQGNSILKLKTSAWFI